MSARRDRSFLAPPDEVSDWRMVLAYDAAARAGVLSALPATPEDVARRGGLHARGVRAVLDVLAVWAIVERGQDGAYGPGPRMPGGDLAALWHHHARTLRLWSVHIDDRLHGVDGVSPRASTAEEQEVWYAALAAFARPAAPAVVDACLRRFRGARRVLDLGGGHGEHALAFARRGLAVTMQDRAPAIELARRAGRLGTAGVALFEGDFFDTLPAGPFDIAFCAAVTDTYDGAGNAALCRRLAGIVAPGGGVALLAFVRGRNNVVPVFSVQMLAAGGRGDTHREEDYRRWLGQAGFGAVEVHDIDGLPQSLLLAAR